MAGNIPGLAYTLDLGVDQIDSVARFIDRSNGVGVLPAAGGRVVGVRTTKGRTGEGVAVTRNGKEFVEAGGVIADGDDLATDNLGRAVKAEVGQTVVGVAFGAASGAGIFIPVLLNA